MRLVAAGLAAAAVAFAVAFFVPWLPISASKEGDRIDFVFWFVTVICIAIFALVVAVILYSVVRFRARPDDDSDGAPIHGHTGLEIAWTAVPAALVTAIAVVSAVALAENDHLPKRHLRVNVTAQQFAWSFSYPKYKGLTVSALRVPLNEAVELKMQSKDVIHSFWVPQFRQKQDVVTRTGPASRSPRSSRNRSSIRTRTSRRATSRASCRAPSSRCPSSSSMRSSSS